MAPRAPVRPPSPKPPSRPPSPPPPPPPKPPSGPAPAPPNTPGRPVPPVIIPPPVHPRPNNPGNTSQAQPNTPSATLAGSPKPDSRSGLPLGGLIGIIIGSLVIVGLIITLVIRRIRRMKNQTPRNLEGGNTLLSHLPTSPTPPTNILRHSSDHQYPKGQGEPMHHQKDHHHGGIGGCHEDRHGDRHDGQHQDFSAQGHGFDQGQAQHGSDEQRDCLDRHQGSGNGGGDNGYQSFSDTGHRGGDGQSQGLSDQGTSQGCERQTQIQPQGHGFDQGGANQVGCSPEAHDPSLQGFSDQGHSGTFQTTIQPICAPDGSVGLGSSSSGLQNAVLGGNQSSLPDRRLGQGYSFGPQQQGDMSSGGSMTRPVLIPPGNGLDLSHIGVAGEGLGDSSLNRQTLLDQTRYDSNTRVLSPNTAALPPT
ncbi:MAG: hypothetical protein J3Q66DRAFT_393393 [Benniella sp.]|nr:MAG: hypothetical protein J3Q66DRAFT_393393 [Benniella sp.]